MWKFVVTLILSLFNTFKAPVPTPTPSPSPIATLIPSPTINLNRSVHFVVPFTVQAPFSEWKDPRQQDACEEASALMAVKWSRGESIASPSATKAEILAISQFQTDHYGQYHDTSVQDTVDRIFKAFYKFNEVQVETNITRDDIIRALETGHLVITPMNGQIMGNPYFTPPGPERHNVLIIGYDANKQEFITNDPGVTNGKDYRYPAKDFFNAIRDYPTGDHIPIPGNPKNMIVISKL